MCPKKTTETNTADQECDIIALPPGCVRAFVSRQSEMSVSAIAPARPKSRAGSGADHRIHLWFDRTITSSVSTTQSIVCRGIQWIFTTTHYHPGRRVAPERELMSRIYPLVVKRIGSFINMRREEIFEWALRELGESVSQAKGALW